MGLLNEQLRCLVPGKMLDVYDSLNASSTDLDDRELKIVASVDRAWDAMLINFFYKNRWIVGGNEIVFSPGVKLWKKRSKYLSAVWDLIWIIYDVHNSDLCVGTTIKPPFYPSPEDHFKDLILDLANADCERIFDKWTEAQWSTELLRQSTLINQGKNPYAPCVQQAQFSIVQMGLDLTKTKIKYVDITEYWTAHKAVLNDWVKLHDRKLIKHLGGV